MQQETGFTAVSLFAGCGGSDLGLSMAGITPIWANEIDSTACELYERIVNGSVECADISKIDRFPKSDILIGCYPCQGYSQGGRRTAKDSINFLYREFDRALRQISPLAFIVENVNGMRFSQNKGLLKNQLTRFRLAGYRVKYSVLDAKDYGLAQDRKRLFIVGIRSNEKTEFQFPKATHGCTPDLIPYSTLREAIWNFRNAPTGSYCDDEFHWYYLSRNRRRTWSQQSPCIVANWRHVCLHPNSPPLRKVGADKWEFTRDPHKARRLNYLECAALQGFPDPSAFDRCSVQKRFTAIGNAVPPPLFHSVASSLATALVHNKTQSDVVRQRA